MDMVSAVEQEDTDLVAEDMEQEDTVEAAHKAVAASRAADWDHMAKGLAMVGKHDYYEICKCMAAGRM